MNYRRLRARVNAVVLPLVNRARWRWRRRTAPTRMFVQDQVARVRTWLRPPPRKPTPLEVAMQDRAELMHEARRRRHRWARGPLDPQAMADPFRRM